MEINFDKQQKTQGVIKISVNKTDFQPGVDQKIKEYSKTANIKGFRPGKVPQGMIRKMYGNALIVEEINKLVSESLTKYLKESDIQFLGEPLPIQKEEEINWESQVDFDFEYEIGFAESFDLKLDKKVKMEKYSIKIDDQVINETIENLQRQFGETENTEVSADNDTLYGQLTDPKGTLNQDVSVDLRDVEKSLSKKLTGIKIGTEVEFDPKKGFKNDVVLKNQLRLSDEEYKKLKKVNYKVQAISHYKLAPLDQELYDKTFGKDNVKDESAFREKVKEVVANNYEGEEAHFFDHKIKEQVTSDAKISLPDEFLKKWLSKSNEEITPELLDLEYETYAKELKWSLVRNKLVKDREINVEHDDVTNEAKELIKKQMAGSGLGDQMNDQLDTFANNYLQGENGENYMKIFNQVQTNKVLDLIKGEITIKPKEVSLDDFRKL